MKITNAKQIVLNPSGKYIYENSNFLNGECIVCEHPKTGSTHANTRLSHWKDGVFTPLLTGFVDGLEDAYIVKVDEWYHLFAELKVANGGQENIAWFKSKQLKSGWIYVNTLWHNTSIGWQNHSISSPTCMVEDGKIILLYEGRPVNDLNDFHTGWMLLDPNGTTLRRDNDIISTDNFVPDDIRLKNGKYELSCHTFDGTKWYGMVYESFRLSDGWKHKYTQTLDCETIGEIYFTDTNKVYFYKKNFEGMWRGYLENVTNPIHIPISAEDKMLDLQVTVSNEDGSILFEWTHPSVNNVHFEDDVRGYFKTCDRLCKGMYIFENTNNATNFRIRASNGQWENWVNIDVKPPVVVPPVIEPTNDIAKLLDEADAKLIDIKNIHNTIRRLL